MTFKNNHRRAEATELYKGALLKGKTHEEALSLIYEEDEI